MKGVEQVHSLITKRICRSPFYLLCIVVGKDGLDDQVAEAKAKVTNGKHHLCHTHSID